MLESPFNKVAGLRSCNFIKKETPTKVFSVEICQTFKDILFYRTPQLAASENLDRQNLKMKKIFKSTCFLLPEIRWKFIHSKF